MDAVFAFLFFILFITFSIAGSYRLVEILRDTNSYPIRKKYTPQNVFDIYLILGLGIIKQELDDRQNQMNYFRRFLLHKFKTEANHSSYYLRKFISKKYSTDSALIWISKRMPKEERVSLLDFLTDLAYLNGTAIKRELQYIHYVGNKMGFTVAEVNATLRIRFNRMHGQKQQKRTFKSTISRSVQIKHALTVMGLSNTSDKDLIKKTYRQLAKKHHPDRYINQSKEEQQKAHERFTEINLANDFLEKNL
jgi:DnaJ like chaperone protein